MSLDLAFDDAQAAIADAVAAFAREACPEEAVRGPDAGFSRERWRELAALGVLGLGAPEGEGGALELVAAHESLGRAVFPGPLAAHALACRVLPERRAELASGACLVALGSPPLLPFAPFADVFLEAEGERVFRLRPRGSIEPVPTLGGEPWGRVACQRGEPCPDAGAGLALHDLAAAAYLAAAARRLVDDTAEHARTRRQFGKAIGEFQAVAHPLADCAMQVDAAASLARGAASAFDRRGPDAARVPAATARLSARRAALHTAHTAHQLFGAVGITREGPVFHVSRRILQLAGQPPGHAAAREAVLAAWGLPGPGSEGEAS